jgi:hypothetical protein
VCLFVCLFLEHRFHLSDSLHSSGLAHGVCPLFKFQAL